MAIQLASHKKINYIQSSSNQYILNHARCATILSKAVVACLHYDLITVKINNRQSHLNYKCLFKFLLLVNFRLIVSIVMKILNTRIIKIIM